MKARAAARRLIRTAAGAAVIDAAGTVALRLTHGRLPGATPTMRVDPRDGRGPSLLFRGGHPSKTTARALDFAVGGRTITTYVDVGANYGECVRAVAPMMDAHGQIFAFEPNLAVFPHLVGNTAGLTQPKVFSSLAASKTWSQATLTIPEASSGLGSLEREEGERPVRHTQVVTAPLADALPPPRRGGFTLLKVDVEGHETSVLLGLGQWLAGVQEWAIVCECHPGQLTALHALCHDRSWRLFGQTDKTWLQVTAPCPGWARDFVIRPSS